ncbi:ParM/StbA family protein [Exiguobacterium antarcticum]|uniref:ParM/StbA family protein n=1 Tax=Exiguobacterium antarcticum TaxID=132920 RepID=A0ABT6R5E6_9BACL|nr:ParM/StbA family protein [Exiguobacterium antarcticum]MDI3236180.1 ParM/StbA family protein [Exiguobacterium antarcticum]
MKKVVGIDIGNAKTEIAFEHNKEVRFERIPSVTSYLTSVPDAPDIPLDKAVEDLLNNIVVYFSSTAVKQNGNYFVGKRALQSDRQKNVLNLQLGGKSDNDIPIISSLSLVAASSVKEYFEENQALPESLQIELKMVTAIPSSEFNTETSAKLTNRFKGIHNLTLYVSDQQVSVTIKVSECRVTEEGKTSMLAFAYSSPDILSLYNAQYNENKKPSDFLSSRSLHTDIGDGTTEFTVIDGVNPVPGQSEGIRSGVGHASEEAAKLLKKDSTMSISSKFTRQAFQEWLKRDDLKGDLARDYMNRSIYSQAQSISEQIQTAFQELAASDISYLFVHGGGSVTFKDALKEELTLFTKNNFCKLVWIPEEYASNMNSRGTFILAKNLYQSKK